MISHNYDNTLVSQYYKDGYINLTAMTQANDKLIPDYLRLDVIKAFLEKLSRTVGIPIVNLECWLNEFWREAFMVKFRSGQLIPLHFKDRSLTAIVIDPDGLGKDQPTIGLGYRGMDRHTGVPAQTFSDRVSEIQGVKCLQLPSGKSFRVSEIQGEDGNSYSAIEAADWVEIARDWLKNPGKLRKNSKDGLIDFLAWYAVEGIYAQAYTFLKRTYTRQDDEVLRQWLLSRESNKSYRKDWGWEVKDKDPAERYGYWTNYIYLGLFGMKAEDMKREWDLVAGSKKIARNYIPQAIGLEAVGYCEKMVAQVDLDDLLEAHEEAIRLTRRKYASYFPASQ